MRTRILMSVVGLASAFALTACVDLGPKPERGPAPAAPAGQADAAGPSPTPAPPKGPGLAIAETALGKVITTAKGVTLYRFDKDAAKPPKTTCYNACAQKWPAYPWSENLTLDGIDQSLIGKVERTDGTYQLTIAGWAAYTFTGDGAPGDVNGQGTGGTWWAFQPDGKKNNTKPADSGGTGY